VGLEHLRGGIALVGGEVVKDDDGAGGQLGDEDLFDGRVEGASRSMAPEITQGATIPRGGRANSGQGLRWIA
jgi:hypothetical protein